MCSVDSMDSLSLSIAIIPFTGSILYDPLVQEVRSPAVMDVTLLRRHLSHSLGLHCCLVWKCLAAALVLERLLAALRGTGERSSEASLMVGEDPSRDVSRLWPSMV